MLTRRGLTILGALLLCVSSAGIAQAQNVSKAQAALTETLAKAKSEDCAGALQVMATLIAMPDFKRFDDQLQAFTFDLGLRCAVVLKQDDVAYTYAVEGGKFDDATSFVFRFRLYAEVFGKKNYGTAVDIAERLAAKFPDEFNDIPVPWYGQLDRSLEETHDDANHRRLLALLSSPTFVPSDLADSGDLFRADYAVMLNGAGDPIGAAAVIALIRDFSVRMRLSLDPRVRKLIPADFDAHKAAEDDLSHLRDIAASHPGSSGIILAMSQRLLALGRPEEALATLFSQARQPTGGSDD